MGQISKKLVTIVNYGMGNLHSLKNALNHLEATCLISSEPKEIREAEILILPGVGSFGQAMRNIISGGLKEPLVEAVVNRGIPILGICLGMQLLADIGEEDGDNNGFGFIPGRVTRFAFPDLRLPHIGFNSVKITSKENKLFEGIGVDSDFYFVHSYYYECQNPENKLGITEYGAPFTSAVQKGKIFGVQFHPEKSQSNGLKLLSNFVKIASTT